MFEALLNERHARIDRLQLAGLFGLMALGLLFVYSATMISEAAITAPLVHQLWFRQLLWYVIGISAGISLCWLDYRILARWSFVIYWLTIILLIAVIIPGVGSVRFNARRWFDLRFFQLQPSEF